MFHGTVTDELTHHEKWSKYYENVVEEKKNFVFVKFSGLQLKSMENLQSCVSIKVCIFSNNFITDIHPLQNCKKLVKIDLHGNQIKNLPNAEFWSGFKCLKLLFLHNNGISKLKNVCALSACPSLIALTLFDCPVSLKKGYRHVVVNSIWPLKALDYYIVSDEEIVQNWRLPERFKTYSNRLFFNFCRALKKGSTYKSEMDNIQHIISNINRILAHNSPILILQRYVRGYLVRKALSPFLSKRKHKYKTGYKAKWICIHKGYDNQLSVPSETNIQGKYLRWKHQGVLRRSRDSLSEFLAIRTHNSAQGLKLMMFLCQRKLKYDAEDEKLDKSFKISVFKAPIHTADSVKYASVLKTREQDSLPVYGQPRYTSLQKPLYSYKDIMLKKNMKDFFAVHRAGMKLQSVCDVDRYYSQLKNLEDRDKRVSAQNMAHASQEKSTLKVQEMLNEKIHNVKKHRLKEKETMQKGFQQFWQNRNLYLTRVKERRNLFLKEKRQKTEERLLIQNLSNERSRVLRGMIHMHRLKMNEEVQNEKKMIVKQRLEIERFQRNLVKQMKEHGTLEAFRSHNKEKFVNDMMAFPEYYENFQDVEAKVNIGKKNLVFEIPERTTKENDA
ncbi:leucine-rich repeat and IQ domain-containing protein 3 [Sorex araneus]|uniref:leucine-rich repeat and IQ domain-containing protein 3 n=1 Tax=Sorex araneus TaxID=42254 RepID=UPI002433E1B6|nr:leucine-rich repeat and IQ domain-containing protein 3 [Sorex araneus]